MIRIRSVNVSVLCWLMMINAGAWGQSPPPKDSVKLPSKDRLHLFLLVGQSNMAGRGEVARADQTPDPRTLMLTKDNQWKPAVDPLHFDKPAAVGVGLGRTFGLEVANAHPGVVIGLIPCAAGGSPIASWEPGGYHGQTKSHPYDDALHRAGIAMKSGTLKGILWHQGESDATPELAKIHEQKLHELIARFRKDLNASNVPFIAGQMGQFADAPWNDAKKQVDAAHRRLADNVPQSAFVSAEGLKHKGDRVHFDSESYRELGRRYARAYLALADGSAQKEKAAALDIGARRELFVDRYLVGQITGEADLHLHQPTPREVVLVTDQPWEGNTCAYYTIFQDGDLYRMYYRGSHADEKTQKGLHREVTCYAESKDGVHWTRPNLGLFEWEGSKENNVVLDGLGTHCFVAFRDDNPRCRAEARYKGISRGSQGGKSGLFVFQSPDAIHWSLIKNEPVITKGAFDSQNLAFWDPVSGLYVDYHRIFVDKVRAIMTCTSEDFVNWTEPVLLKYPDAPKQHLYTNAIRPYDRAPHLRIGFPTRYLPPDSFVEPLFMSSRDGVTFHRWNDPIIPRTAPKDRDGNRSNYAANGLVQLPGKDREYSLYATEAYYKGSDSRLRRFTYRVDGFVSLRGAAQGGELITKPLTFDGEALSINAATKPKGQVRIEIQDSAGQPINGLSLADFDGFQGDEIEHRVTWQGKADLKPLAGNPVRLRFVVQDADVYSFQFQSARK